MNKQEIRKLFVAAGEQSMGDHYSSSHSSGFFTTIHIYIKSFSFFPGWLACSFAARAHALKLHSLLRIHKRSTCSKSRLYSASYSVW